MNHLNNVLYQRLIQGLVFQYIISSGHFDRGITAGLENASSFDEANISSLDQGKHLASSLSRISLYNIYIMS
jgi:hypothetical protein